MEHQLNVDCTEIKACNLISIDLSNPDIHQSVASIKQACMETGMFYVINHGISIEDMDEVIKQSKKFFAMPLDEKKKLCSNKIPGYRPQLQKDYVETYTTSIGTIEADDPTNVWPPADILPGWKEIIQKYQLATFNVGREILKLIAIALGLNINYFDQPKLFGKENGAFCTFLHFGDEENDSSLKLGALGHTDAGIITLLATDHNLGLQVCVDKHAKPRVWEYVLPMKGAFIVNVAETLRRLSNYTFNSIMHRVIHRKDRYSIGLFLVPNDNCVIECASSESNPPKYPPTTFKDFVSSHFKEISVDDLDKHGKSPDA